MSELTSLIEWLRAVTPAEIKTYYWAAARFYGSPWFYVGIAEILSLEWIRPAIREQRVFSCSGFTTGCATASPRSGISMSSITPSAS